MALRLGTGLGLSRGGFGGLALGRVLDLDMATGRDYSALSITSNSAIGLVKGHDGLWVPKPAGYLAGLEGARVNGSAPAWDDGSGNALSGVRWTGPKAATATLNAYSSPAAEGVNGWTFFANSTDLGAVPGPDGSATSARRISFTADGQYFRPIVLTPADYCAVIIKGTAGNKINLYYGSTTNNYNWQFTLTGGWDAFSRKGTSSGTPDGTRLSLNTYNNATYGGTGVTAAQTVDVFMLQVSAAPDAYIPTVGTNLTRLAETVTFPYTISNAVTVSMEADFARGIPNTSERAFGTPAEVTSLLYFPSGANGAISGYIGADLTPSPAIAVTADVNKIKVRVNNGVWTGAVNSTITNNISFTPPTWPPSITIGSGWGTVLKADINKVKIWNRALSDTEMLNV